VSKDPSPYPLPKGEGEIAPPPKGGGRVGVLREEICLLKISFLARRSIQSNSSARHFRRQQIIAGYIVDFYCHAADLVIEIDGDIHEYQKEYDAERNKVLTGLGLKVLHIPNETVLKSLPQVLKTILKECIQ
jgi:very-short-patch-repair endonuclease